MPFLLLPFRPISESLSPAKNFIRSYFKDELGENAQYQGAGLQSELRLIEPSVRISYQPV